MTDMPRPERIQEILTQGRAMLEREEMEITDEAVVWRLLQEAAETNKALRSDGPRRQTQHGLEYHHTALEIWGTNVSMAVDKISYPPKITLVASKEALGRYLEVMSWLQFIHTGKNERRTRKMVLALAGGMSLQMAADLWGYSGRSSVQWSRNKSVENIVHRLSQIVSRRAA